MDAEFELVLTVTAGSPGVYNVLCQGRGLSEADLQRLLEGLFSGVKSVGAVLVRRPPTTKVERDYERRLDVALGAFRCAVLMDGKAGEEIQPGRPPEDGVVIFA